MTLSPTLPGSPARHFEQPASLRRVWRRPHGPVAIADQPKPGVADGVAPLHPDVASRVQNSGCAQVLQGRAEASTPGDGVHPGPVPSDETASSRSKRWPRSPDRSPSLHSIVVASSPRILDPVVTASRDSVRYDFNGRLPRSSAGAEGIAERSMGSTKRLAVIRTACGIPPLWLHRAGPERLPPDALWTERGPDGSHPQRWWPPWCPPP